MNIIQRLMELKVILEGVKPLYNEMDELIMALSDNEPDGHLTQINNDTFVVLIDNFKYKNVSFKVAAVRRFEFEVMNRKELRQKLSKNRSQFTNIPELKEFDE